MCWLGAYGGARVACCSGGRLTNELAINAELETKPGTDVSTLVVLSLAGGAKNRVRHVTQYSVHKDLPWN